MKNNEKDLIDKLITKNITKDIFIKKICYKKDNLINYLEKSLKAIIEEKNAEELDYLMYVCFEFDIFSDNIIDMLCDIFEAEWHYKHEDIALLFEEVKPTKAIDSLYRVAISNYSYLDFDESYALAVKCIWALGKIGNEEAIEKLKLLSMSSNEIIKKNALEQLERIK